jgi:hypothetical protein
MPFTYVSFWDVQQSMTTSVSCKYTSMQNIISLQYGYRTGNLRIEYISVSTDCSLVYSDGPRDMRMPH